MDGVNMSDSVPGAVASANLFDFFLFLLACFFVVCLVLAGITAYKNWKRRQLTNPTKDKVYKHHRRSH